MSEGVKILKKWVASFRTAAAPNVILLRMYKEQVPNTKKKFHNIPWLAINFSIRRVWVEKSVE